MKRKANLIPYYISEDKQIWFYLSRRSLDAKMFPDYVSFWGGGIEKGETSEQAMLREIREELCLTAEDYIYLGDYITPGCIKSIFYTQMDKKEVDMLPIHEGQYGRWFTLETLAGETNVTQNDQKILADLHKYIFKKL